MVHDVLMHGRSNNCTVGDVPVLYRYCTGTVPVCTGTRHDVHCTVSVTVCRLGPESIVNVHRNAKSILAVPVTVLGAEPVSRPTDARSKQRRTDNEEQTQNASTMATQETNEMPSAEEQHEPTIETLECGSSLAELEHGVEDRPESAVNASINSVASLRETLAEDVLTSSSMIETFTSPFEVPPSIKSTEKYLQVPLVYCDQTASNRPVQSIEDYMGKVCLPLYGNTHTNTSITGSQSTAFCAEARQIVAEGTNSKITGKASLDVVLFAGNGATSAVELLIDCMGLKHSTERPVVFVGPYEHHSNLLPWRESGCEIVMVPEHPLTFSVNLEAFERLLTKPEYEGRLKMGTFTAASNVTGKVSDVDAIAAMLHQHGALAFFDYATGAPYLSMNMNPGPSPQYASPSLVAKDAIFLSPHKMLGGVGAPGVLIIKKHLVNQVNAPSKSGGGTVFYVTSTHHRFLSNRIERYEGGTPNVAGIIRAGLTFLLKRKTEQRYLQLQAHKSLPPTLADMEYSTYMQVAKALVKRAPNLVLLGDASPHTPHLPIFSFLIRCGKRFLHYNYVCALLNDVFGIQSRGGCQCSGPYSQRLLGLTEIADDGTDVPNERNKQVEHALVHYKERAELLRPGFSRISLPFKGLRDIEVDYVVDALVWVAKNAWSLMPQYRCNHRTGEWRHYHRQGKPLGRTERKWLSHYDMLSTPSVSTTSTDKNASVASILEQARQNAGLILDEARKDQRSIAQALKMNEAGDGLGDDDVLLEKLRWYVYPKECATWLTIGASVPPETDSPQVLGALQPTALNVANLSVTVDYSAKSSAFVPSPKLTTITDAPSRKRKSDESRPVIVKEDSSTITVDMVFAFREGEHMGESPISEIEAGFDDGELSEHCEVYDIKSDSWVPIAEFLRTLKKTRREEQKPAAKKAVPKVANVKEDSSTITVDMVFAFREGEHMGESPISEIEAGFDDGELSEHCEVYDIKSDSWVPIAEFLRTLKKTRREEQKPAAKKAVPKVEVAPVDSSKQQLNSAKDEKNQKKKPARDSSQWGKSQNVPVKTETAPSAESGDAGVPTITFVQELPAAFKVRKGKGVKPPPKLMRMVTQAMVQWNMIEEGDRLMLGLSGGKDSMSLLHCLLEFQRRLPINFEIEVCTIDPMTPSFDPSPLIPYVESLGLKYHYIRDDIVDRANKSGRDGKVVSSLCAFCARMKRGNLYSCARKNNCNKLVLAQHLDDCAESFLMSVMHNGFLRTMKANYKINAGDMSVIRPMVYCRESLMTAFAKAANLPVINENCPACFEEPKERARVKKLLSREETLFPNFYDNIRRSLIPLMHEDSTAILKCYTEEAVSKSRKENFKKIKLSGKKRAQQHGETVEEEKDDAAKIQQEQEKHDDAKRVKLILADASDDDLIKEISRRKAEKFKLAGSMKRHAEVDAGLPEDGTGQVCSLNGGEGGIPCSELME